MKLISAASALALYKCINDIAGNITYTWTGENQRAFTVEAQGDRFRDTVNKIHNCLKLYNVTGTTSYIDIRRTDDDQLISWSRQATRLEREHVSGMTTYEGRQATQQDSVETVDKAKRYLEHENINMRGYYRKGCDHDLIWSLDNYGVNGDCIDTVMKPKTFSLGYDYPWNTDQLWAQTSHHHECRPKSNGDESCHDDRSITSLDMTNAQCWNKEFYSIRVIRQLDYPWYWRDCKV